MVLQLSYPFIHNHHKKQNRSHLQTFSSGLLFFLKTLKEKCLAPLIKWDKYNSKQDESKIANGLCCTDVTREQCPYVGMITLVEIKKQDIGQTQWY